MSARIVVEAGTCAVQEYLIEETLLRLGSGADCKPRLDPSEVSEHAATLEWRNRRYRIFNKTDRPLYIDSQSLAVQGSREWQAGQRLKLADGVILRLEIEGDPAPYRRAAPVVTGRDVVTDPGPGGGVEKIEPKKKTANWQVIALVVGGLLAVLSFFIPKEGQPGPTTPTGPAVNMYEVIAELRKEEGESPDALWRILDEARAADLRGHRAEANRGYRRVLIILRQRHGESLTSASKAEKQAEAYVRRRLTSPDE